MALTLPFLNGATRKKRSQIIAVDLGSRTTKAVLFERRGDILALTRYALLDAPASDKKLSPEQMAEHLRAVSNALGNATKYVALAVGVNDALVKLVDFPQIPVNEMRQVLKMNHKNYLQQDLPNHLFDCYVMPPRVRTEAEKKMDKATPLNMKLKVLVTAARQQLVTDFIQAAAMAGLSVDALIGPIRPGINASTDSPAMAAA